MEQGRKIDRGAEERCFEAIEVYKPLKRTGEKVEFLTAAGFADRSHYPEQHFTIATMTEAFLDWKGVNYRDVIVLNESDDPQIWGTAAEVKAFCEYGKCCGEIFTLHIVSHWWHLPRLWLLTRKLECNVILYGARGSNNGILYELYKFPGQVIMDFLQKIKQKPS